MKQVQGNVYNRAAMVKSLTRLCNNDERNDIIVSATRDLVAAGLTGRSIVQAAARWQSALFPVMSARSMSC